MPKLPKGASWILRGLLAATIIFVAYNLVKDRNIDKVDQSNAPSVQQISSATSEPTGSSVIAGDFSGIAGHTVSGKAEIVELEGKKVLKFNDEFSSQSGPDLEVYLSKNRVASGEELGEFVSLKSLKELKGAQVYAVPDDVSEYQSVVVWCRAFSVGFGAADLQ